MSQQLDLRRTIILTTLPYRVVSAANADETSTLRLSVYLSPRLWVKGTDQPPLTLNDYPEFQDFPALLAQMIFRVAFDNGTLLDATLDSAPRSDVWKAIFPASTPVIPFEFDNPLDPQGNSKAHQSPHLGNLHSMIQDVYTRVGTDPAYGQGADLPSTGRLSRDPVLNAIATPTTKTQSTIFHAETRHLPY